MISILEKYEHNQDFHQIVDFVEASHIKYALTFNPTVYVSHIRQFWSTARIKTIEEGTKILATVDGKLKIVSESSIRRNLKLNDEAGISSLLDAEHFENLQLMRYNILPNQKIVPLFDSLLVPQGEGLVTPTESHHTPTYKASQSSRHELSSPLLPPVPPESLPTVIPFDNPLLGNIPEELGLLTDQDRANIAKTSTLPSDSTPRVTSLAVDEGSMQQKLNELMALCTSLQRQQSEMVSKFEAQELEINTLKARIKLLKDKDRGVADQSEDDAPIKGRRLDEGEEAAERVSDDTEEMAIVLTSIDAASILTSGGIQEVPLLQKLPLLLKGKEKMVESDTPKNKKLQEQIDVQVARELEEEMVRDAQRMKKQIAMDAEITRIHAKEELQMLIDGLDRNNETVAKYMQEYYQFAIELPIERGIELISDLVKYQDHYAKTVKYQTQQRKPLSMKQQKEFYMSVLKSHAGWKARHFGDDTRRNKREESVKKLKTSEEVKATEEVPKEKVKEMMQLVPIKEVYVDALEVKHLIIDWKHLDREDLNQLWELVKETLSIRPTTIDKKIEIWVELKRLYEPDVEDQL
nr:xylulose kinase-1 [Tanacetum cinerariifolium]